MSAVALLLDRPPAPEKREYIPAPRKRFILGFKAQEPKTVSIISVNIGEGRLEYFYEGVDGRTLTPHMSFELRISSFVRYITEELPPLPLRR